MAILTTGNSYSDGNQITSSNLNAIVNSATFSDPVDTSSGLNLTSDSPPKIAINTSLSNKVLTGGSLNNCPIGAATPSTGVFTTLTATGNLDIDGVANLDAVDIDGAVQLDSTLTVGVNDTGYDVKFFGATSGAYMLWDESQDDLILGGAARLGIGTTSPAVALDVVGAGTITAGLNIGIDNATAGSINVFGGANSAAEGGEIKLYNHADADGSYDFWRLDSDTNGFFRLGRAGQTDLTIDHDGYVGIGTSNADKALVVAGVGAEIVIDDTDTTDTPRLRFRESGATAASISTDASNLIFDTGTTERVRIDSSGNVGIGKTPSTTLDVNGTATVSGDTVLNSDLEINVSGASNSSKAIVINSSGTNFESDAGLIQGTHAGSGSLTGGYWLKFNANSADKFTVKGNGDTAIAGNIDVDGTANLDAVDIDGAVQIDSTLTVGVDDTGHDVKFFGATSGSYMLWDESTDDLILGGAAQIGVGITSPQAPIHTVGDSAFAEAAIFANNGSASSWARADWSNDQASGTGIVYRDNSGNFVFRNDNSSGSAMTSIIMAGGSTAGNIAFYKDSSNEIARFDSDGKLGINNSGPSVRLEIGDGAGTSDHVYHNKSGSGAFPGITDTTSHGIMLESQGANGSTLHVSRTNSAAGNFSRQGTGDVVTFHNTSSSVTEAGSIEITGATSVAYQTSSDYRLKENLVSISDGIDRVKQLKPLKFNFINEPRIVDGFLAHEVSDIVPEAIGGEKDAMKDQEYEVSPAVYNEEGELVTEAVIGTRSVPDYQGIDQSKLVPLLTAALQEAVAKIEALEARVESLEG